MTRSDEPKYLTAKELIDRWRGRISASTLATWRYKGRGPVFVKIGGRVLYPLQDVVAYEEKGRRSGS